MDSHYVHMQKECCICFNCELESQEKIINLNKNDTYNMKCDCNPTIHNKCLETWFMTKNECPICHIKIEKKKTICEKISSLLIKIYSRVENALILMFIVIIIMSYSTHT